MDETQAARDRLALRLRTALALHDDGVDLMRQNLRRRYPTDDEAAISTRLRDWLLSEVAPGPGFTTVVHGRQAAVSR